MKILEEIAALPPAGAPLVGPPSVTTIGVFDGVHLGHLRLLRGLQELAAELSGAATVVTFRDHPDHVLAGSAPPLLVSIEHRLRLLRRAGVERVLLLTFDEALRAMPAGDFAERILFAGLRTVGVYLGHDAAFGHRREGDVAFLHHIGAERSPPLVVRQAEPLTVGGAPISSTRIRAAITGGDLALAHRLLGRWPSALGEVVRGDGRGRPLGFPTANVVPQTEVLPPHGVYAVEVLHDAVERAGVANLGIRPTFAAVSPAPILEVHLLDFDGDLYGATLEVAFRARIRDERRFADTAELRRQIAADADAARALLAG